MGQKEFNRHSISILSASRHGVTGTGFSHASCLSEDIGGQPPLPAEQIELIRQVLRGEKLVAPA